MIDIETTNLPGEIEIASFLLRSQYGKYRLWLNANEENVAAYLSEQIHEAHSKGKVFIALSNGRMATVMVFRMQEWDTRHFGFKCVKIDNIFTDKTLSKSVIEESLEKILIEFKKYCMESAIRFVVVSVDSWDYNTSIALQKAGYKYILTWVDGILGSSNDIPKVSDDFEIGAVKPEEMNRLKEICALSYFKGGRFYLDANFDRKLVDSMYANLVNYSFENGDTMLVHRYRGRLAGLFIWGKIVTYRHFSDLRIAPARFLIVDPEYRNKKVGYSLFIRSLEYFRERSDLMTTGLDVHNVASLNLHAKSGFKINYTHNVYHWWNEAVGQTGNMV